MRGVDLLPASELLPPIGTAAAPPCGQVFLQTDCRLKIATARLPAQPTDNMCFEDIVSFEIVQHR